MFVEPVALNAVPSYARIGQAIIDAVAKRVRTDPQGAERALAAAFRRMEQRQPAVAALVAYELSEVLSQPLQSLAFRLSVLVHCSFEEAFGPRLARVELSDINRSLSRLVADSELRSAWVRGNTYSEDAIAIGQPALVRCLRAEVDRAIEHAPDLEWENLDRFYESLLAMVLVLTQAVAPDSMADGSTLRPS